MKNGSQAIAMDGFVIPDSIDLSLLVVSFYEVHQPNGHAFIVYTDTNRTTATKIKYLSNHKVETEHLKVTKHNEFRSLRTIGEYLIKENEVTYLYTNSNISTSVDYPKTNQCRP